MMPDGCALPRRFPGSHSIVYVMGEGRRAIALAYSESRLGWLRDSDQEAAVGSFRIKQPHHFTFLIALLLAIVGVASTRFQIKYVSAHAFWFVVAAYVVLALGTLIDGL